MNKQLYFENEATQSRYLIVRFDRDNGTVVLRGKNAEFTEKYDKHRFQRMGYRLVEGD